MPHIEDRIISRHITERFLSAVEYIAEHRINGYKSMYKIMDEVGSRGQAMREMKQGIRYVTLDQIVMLVKKFGVNIIWLMLGDGLMFGKKSVHESEQIAFSTVQKRDHEVAKILLEAASVLQSSK